MSVLSFSYPFMVFHKCQCQSQVPVLEMKAEKKSEFTELSYEVKCPVCGSPIRKSVSVMEDGAELTGFLNVFKVVPALKDELAIVKLDTVKAKVKEGKVRLYGDYTYLRFWDNNIERDRITISYNETL